MSYIQNDNIETGINLTERQLIARVQAGDGDAERKLYEAHVDRVFGLAYRMTGDSDIAADFTQDSFIRAFDRIGEFRGDSAFSTWLHSVSVSVVLNGLRKVKRIRQREIGIEVAGSVSYSNPIAEPDLKQKIHRAIDALPNKYRIVFVMHDVEGYTHEEIAKATGARVGTSKAQLSRARAMLRQSLAEFAGEWVS